MADNFNQQLLTTLLDIAPASLDSLALLARLEARPPTVVDLITLQPEIEIAQAELEQLATNSLRMVTRCLTLSPIPANQIPAGF